MSAAWNKYGLVWRKLTLMFFCVLLIIISLFSVPYYNFTAWSSLTISQWLTQNLSIMSHPTILNRHLKNNFSTIFMTLYVLIPSTFSLSILPKLKKKNSYYEITCIITIIQGSNMFLKFVKYLLICSIVFNLLHTHYFYILFLYYHLYIIVLLKYSNTLQ